MSAFPSHLALTQTDRRQWLTVAELARATGEKPRTLRWACKHGDLKHCHRFEANPKGGPDIMRIDLLHAPEKYRLAYANRRSTEAGGEILQLTDKQMAKAAAMAALIQIVDLFVAEQKAARPGVREKDLIASCLSGQRLKNPEAPSVRTYYRARERWIQGGKSLVALADQRGLPGKGVKAQFDEDAFAFFCSIWLKENEPQQTVCYRQLVANAHDQGWSIPSLTTVMKTVYDRVPLAKIVELRQGKEARKNLCDPYLLREWDTLAGNERWVSDHCLLDVIGIDDLPGAGDGAGRPARMWVTTWMDERSRYIVDWRIHRGPNAREVMASFYQACILGGIPSNILIDNGKEYRCKRFAGGRRWREEIIKTEVDETAVRPVLMELGTTPHFALPYGARSKIVEPWHHHCIKETFSRLIPGFCGGNPDEKPEELEAIIKAGNLLPWSKLKELFRGAMEAYELKAHESLGGNCPAFVRQQTLPPKRHPDPRALCIFQLIADRPITVRALAEKLSLSQFFVQNHIAYLSRAGLVEFGNASILRSRVYQVTSRVKVTDDEIEIDAFGLSVKIGRCLQEGA